MLINFGQSRQFTEIEVSVDSLDLILGLIGGYTAILWGVSGFFLANYEGFKRDNSLVGAVYSAAPDTKDREPAEDLIEAKGDIKHDIEVQGRFFYTYREYFFAWILASCCCCLKNTSFHRQRMKRYESF